MIIRLARVLPKKTNNIERIINMEYTYHIKHSCMEIFLKPIKSALLVTPIVLLLSFSGATLLASAQEEEPVKSDAETQEPSNEAIVSEGGYEEWEMTALMGALDDPNPKVVTFAIKELGVLEDVAVRDKIAEFIDSSEPFPQQAALNMVATWGEGARKYLPQVIESMGHKNVNTRRASTFAARSIGDLNKTQLAVVVSLIGDDDTRVRNRAVSIIEDNRGKALGLKQQIIEFTESEDPKVRATALRALGKLGPKANSNALLSKHLKDPEQPVRASAALALGDLGKSAKPQIKDLMPLINDPKTYVRTSALEALGDIGELPDEDVREILKLQRDGNKKVRAASRLALGDIAQLNKNTSSIVAEQLDSLDPQLRINTLKALTQMGEAAGDQAPAIAKRLNDQIPGVRIEAIVTLESMGEAANEFAPQIAEKLKDPNGVAALKAVAALSNMDVAEEDYADSYVDLLKSQNRVLRSQAAAAIGRMGEKASPQFPRIIELLSEKDIKFRYTASFTFQELGESAKGAAPEIAKLLQNENPVIRMAALNALGRMSTGSESVIPDIAAELQDPDRDVRAEALMALGNIGPSTAEYIPEMTKALSDKDRLVRRNAVTALGKMRSSATDAAPQVAQMLKDEDNDIQASTTVALSRIASPDTAPEIIAYIQSLDINQTLNSKNIATAVQALGNMGPDARSVSGSVADLLTAPDGLVRTTAIVTLMKMAPLDREEIIKVLDASHVKPEQSADLRFLAHYAAGGDSESTELIDWLGVDRETADTDIPREQAQELLGIFLQNWELVSSSGSLKNDLAKSMTDVVTNGEWTADDLPLLNEAEGKLTSGSFTEQAKEVKLKIDEIES